MRQYTTGRYLIACLITLVLALRIVNAVAKPADSASRTAPLAPDAPQRHVVHKGETLWSIAALFLKDPWRWPSIYAGNPGIKNPNLIYPGDVLALVHTKRGVRVRLERSASLPVVHLSPHVRAQQLKAAIPTIPISAIRPFLSRSLVLNKGYLKDSGYLLRPLDNRLLVGAHERVYARGLKRTHSRYRLVERGPAYTDPASGATLGYAALYIGAGRVLRWGDPQTVLLTRTTREARAGNRFIPLPADELDSNFMPHPPARPVHGQIIAVMDDLTRQSGYTGPASDTYGRSPIGQYQVVVLDRGKDDGLALGDVLSIYRRGKTVNDQYAGGHFASGDFVEEQHGGSAFGGQSVKLPDARAGELLVFRAFKRVSFALVMQVNNEVHVLDLIKSPGSI